MKNTIKAKKIKKSGEKARRVPNLSYCVFEVRKTVDSTDSKSIRKN
jgi:hypothetical protein